MAEPLAVTGSVSDVVSMALGVSEAMAADAGFNCSSLTIRFKLPKVKMQSKGATAAEKAERPHTAAQKPEGQSSASDQPKLLPVGPPILVIGRYRDVLNKNPKKDTTEQISPVNTEIGLRVVKAGDIMVCTVCLLRLHGWDSKVGDQISIELTTPPDLSGAQTILSIFGLVNPFGFGFARFYGSLSVEATHQGVTTAPIGEMSIATNSWRFKTEQLKSGFFLNVEGSPVPPRIV